MNIRNVEVEKSLLPRGQDKQEDKILVLSIKILIGPIPTITKSKMCTKVANGKMTYVLFHTLQEASPSTSGLTSQHNHGTKIGGKG